MKLAGKVALITGAGSGMGRSAAELFAKEGAKVLVVDTNSAGGHGTVKQIEQAGGVAQFIAVDVTKAAEFQRAIQATVEQYARLDILFNNAGIVIPMSPVEDIDEEDWEKIIAVNLKSMFLGCKYAVPIMKEQGGGVIINTSSIAGERPAVFQTAYAASKGGINAATKGMAVELGAYNIRVNCISPGCIATPMWDDVATKGEDSDRTASMQVAADMAPLGRVGTPEEIAHAALYLASNEAAFTTGIILTVDGAATAGIPFKT